MELDGTLPPKTSTHTPTHTHCDHSASAPPPRNVHIRKAWPPRTHRPDDSSVVGTLLKTASTCHRLISARRLLLLGVLGEVGGGFNSAWPPARAAFHRAVGGAERTSTCAAFKGKLSPRACQSQLICSCADLHPVKLSKEFTSQSIFSLPTAPV